MAHIDLLEHAFPGRVLGSLVRTLDDDATVVQVTPLCSLTIGGLHCGAVPDEIRQTLDINGVALDTVDDVVSRLWETALRRRRDPGTATGRGVAPAAHPSPDRYSPTAQALKPKTHLNHVAMVASDREPAFEHVRGPSWSRDHN